MFLHYVLSRCKVFPCATLLIENGIGNGSVESNNKCSATTFFSFISTFMVAACWIVKVESWAGQQFSIIVKAKIGDDFPENFDFY